MERLEQLLPENEKLLTLMKRKNIKVQKKKEKEYGTSLLKYKIMS